MPEEVRTSTVSQRVGGGESASATSATFCHLDRGYERYTQSSRRQGDMADEIMDECIDEVREYVFLYDTRYNNCKNLIKKAEAWNKSAAELDTTSKYFVEIFFIFAFHNKFQ